ncbi:flagellar basal-body rod protein FlgG [Prosthecomicrobium sp. N25]|uniref:flagellar basal-body rod protein FlgG n=1 Tax=Prosthecomicrobium sp. N25 TaxID=3129254 RepID=UPI0030780938
MKALHIAASGMLAQELNVEVISNNIANMRTTGFKRQRADFQDLLYQNLRQVGSQSSDSGNLLPTGVQIGSGVRTAATPRIMSQGNVESTEKELDLALRGEGFFRISLPDGRTGFTRDGSFERDANGAMVNVNGYPLDPAITIPVNASGLTISAQGAVSAVIGNAPAATVIGQIQVARFVNKSGLEAIGDNIFIETASSGPAQVANPGDEGYGSLLQRHLEIANVNPVAEISDLIAAQRAYEMNSRVIRAADEMMSATIQFR